MRAFREIRFADGRGCIRLGGERKGDKRPSTCLKVTLFTSSTVGGPVPTGLSVETMSTSLKAV